MGWRTEKLSDVRRESGFAYIATTNKPWLSGRERPSPAKVFEDGTPLSGPADSIHNDIREHGAGRYSFWGSSVYFSSSDNTDALSNRRTYSIRFPAVMSKSVATLFYWVAPLLCAFSLFMARIPAVACKLDRTALASLSWPFFVFIAALTVGVCLELAFAYLGRNGYPSLAWTGDFLGILEPSLGPGKSYLARALDVVGLLCVLGALGMAFLRVIGANLKEDFGDLAAAITGVIWEIRWLVAASLVLSAAGMIWINWDPPMQPPRDLELASIIEKQIERAKTIGETDVIIIGDSSALMGVDAEALGALLGGKRVENLSTLEWIGPRGYAKLLQLYFSRGLRVDDVVLLMHGSAFNMPENQYESWESFVVEGRPTRVPADSLAGLRNALTGVYFGRLLSPPMPDPWGRDYGTYLDLGDALVHDRGSIFQPVEYLPTDPGTWGRTPQQKGVNSQEVAYALSGASELRISEFAKEAMGFPIRRLIFGITPSEQSRFSPRAVNETRGIASVVDGIFLQAFGKRFRAIDLTPFEPDDYFASTTHLDEIGRVRLTKELGSFLVGGSPLSNSTAK